jgi:uncharacterized protein YvpB
LKIKAVLISVVFVICLAIVVFIRQSISGTFSIHHVDCYETDKDWSGFRFDNLVLTNDKSFIRIDSLDNPGFLESPATKTDFEFNEILLSWNCNTSISNGLYFVLSVSPDSINWYNFAYQKWGKDISGEIEIGNEQNEFAGIGTLHADIVKLDMAMKFYKFSLAIVCPENELLLLDRISVVYSNTKANLQEYNCYKLPAMNISPSTLALPFMSQHSLPDSISNKACSQVCLAMILNYHNRQYSPIEVAEISYDSYNEIYGNWLYNVQAAYMLGLQKTWVGRHSSFNEIAEEIYKGNPVAISISFENGYLFNAPYKQTKGHIIVVRGFDNDGNVLVNDPYGKTVSEGVNKYDIDELTEAWVSHGGIAYHLWPK